MNIFFSGIGGVGIGPLAEIALDAGYNVTGSDQSSGLMTDQISKRGVSISHDQSGGFLEQRHQISKIDWYIHTAALPTDHPELLKAQEMGIKISKRDDFLLHILKENNLKLIAVAGTHGKTTTTGMASWLGHYFNAPISYLVGTTLSWGPSGRFIKGSEYLVYECDEFDRNFLKFHPYLSVVTNVEHDHPDTYPTEDEYMDAFRQFGKQSESLITWREYADKFDSQNTTLVDSPNSSIQLAGEHNRRNASLILAALDKLGLPARIAISGLNKFPGTSRRFESISRNLYSDYGHTPTEITATLQMAQEISDNVVLIYQPHQNIRQHKIKEQYDNTVFTGAQEIYWLPTYLSREDESLEVLTPEQLSHNINNVHISDLDDELWSSIEQHINEGKLILCMGAGSIDSWIRNKVASRST